jgi:hypothetical protein
LAPQFTLENRDKIVCTIAVHPMVGDVASGPNESRFTTSKQDTRAVATPVSQQDRISLQAFRQVRFGSKTHARD